MKDPNDFSDIGTGHAPEHFASTADMIAAMADQRYRNDAAYRDEVARKIDASATLGVRL